MNFGIHKSIGVVNETVTLSNVLGFDLTLVVRKKGCREHRAFEKRMQEQNPVLQRVLAKASAESLKGRLAGAAPAVIAARFREAFDLASAEISMEAGDYDFIASWPREEAVALVAGWSGAAVVDADTGKPAPCDAATVRELLSDPSPLPADHPRAGEALGDVLVELIHDAADSGAILRAAAVVDGGKDSGSTSASTSEGGPEIPAPASLPSLDELSAPVSPS